MEKRKWEKLGVETSLIGFGCMRFPTNPDGTIEEEAAEKMLDKAYEAGVNYYDTAYMYHDGKSETFVGKWLDKHDRNSYFLTTKLPMGMIDSLEQAKEIFEEQRKKLNKDYFDFYLLHALNKNSFKKSVDLGIIKFCEELKEQGKIRSLGFSFHDDFEAFDEIIHYRDWDLCQIQLNYMDTEEQAGMKGYKIAEELGIPVVVMEPVKGGSLANLPDSVTADLKKIDKEASLASWAYRWCGSLPGVKVILSGMSNMEQTKDNLKTFENFKPLGQEELEAVDKVAVKVRSRVNNNCTACRYCMPCPAGVDIPSNFAIWNGYAMYQNKHEIEFQWKRAIKEEEKAKNCVECGKCEAKCPQKISIRKDLATLQKEFDEIVYAK